MKENTDFSADRGRNYFLKNKKEIMELEIQYLTWKIHSIDLMADKRWQKKGPWQISRIILFEEQRRKKI